MTHLNLDYLADKALFGSPYKVEKGVHPYDRQRAIAGLYEYGLLVWQRRGVIWEPAKTALGYAAILRRSNGLGEGSLYLSPNPNPDAKTPDAWLCRFNAALNHAITYETPSEIPISRLCICIMAIAKIAESGGNSVSAAEAIQSFDRTGA